jgi:hypothetical protein
MKPLLFVFFTFISAIAFSQTDTVRLREIQQSKHKIITDRPPQAVYFLIGGSGPILSVNYDRRFSKRVNGLGFAAGIGYYSLLGINIFSVPVSLNCLIGRSTHFIEVAGGTTFVSATSDLFNDNGDPETASGFIYHLNAGSRYQPTTGGLFIRAGVSPLFDGDGQHFTSYYVGVGYNF